MKTKLLLITLLFFLLNNLIVAQEYTNFKISNISKEQAWNAVNTTFKDFKLPNTYLFKNTTTSNSDFYIYTSLMIKNRLKFKIDYNLDTLTISLINRQYQSNNKWIDNPLPMSKKQAEKILDPIKEKILEITQNKIITQNTISSKKAGIFEDFVIIKTDDPEMDLLALHINNNIIGFDLFDDLKTIKTLIYKENKESEAIILEFDENGLPKYLAFENFNIKINSNASGELDLLIKDNDSKLISKEKNFIVPQTLNNPNNVLFEKNKSHGPFYNNEIFVLDSSISDALGFASTAISGILAGLQGPKQLVLETIKETTKSMGITLADPNNKFLLNELSTAIGLIGLEATVTSATASVMAFAPSLAPIAPQLIFASIVVAGLKISYDAAMRIKERHSTTIPKNDNQSLTKNNNINDEIITGNLPSKDASLFTINAKGLNDKATIIKLAHEAMNKINIYEDKIKALQKTAEVIFTQNKNVNDERFLKIANDIKNLEDASKQIRAEFGEKIKNIAEKETITFTTKKTDPANYYTVGALKVVGAHWTNNWLDILVEVPLQTFKIPKIINEETVYETLGDLRFNYLDKEAKIIRTNTALFSKFAMPFNDFETIEIIDFYNSQPKHVKN
ncbi:hypothetical protein [uncultured Lutibacter sp.]|uniref:hypothetical protein n=1 Tax=uncultured Lutibacter sp. TaxID=437739 RepID=UPI002638EC15|nr:hypothetical protein [uncultured Lutibacter sp.]